MIDDTERRLRQAAPLGAPPGLRARVLSAVADELRSTRPRRALRPATAVAAAALLASLGLNAWVNDRLERRMAGLLDPPPVRRRAAAIAEDVAAITDPAAARWVYRRLADQADEPDDPRRSAERLRRAIRQFTADFKDTADEALHFKKILKWTGIVAGIAIVLLLIANAIFVGRTGARLEERLAALRRAGLPIRAADLGREPIPPERNDETYLRRAADDLKAMEKELDAMYPRVGYPPRPPTPAEQEKLEKLFAAYPKVWPLLEQAAAAPDHDPQLDASLPRGRFLEAYMETVGRHRPLYRILRARSALLLAKGRPDDAVAAQLELLRLTRLWRTEPMLLAFLVTVYGEHTAVEVVNQALQAGPVTPATRQAIEAELARHDTMEGYASALRTERAFSLEMAREIPGGRSWPLRGFVNDLMLRLIDLCDRYVVNASKPYLQVVRERKAASGGRLPNPYGRLATLLEPSFLSGLQAGDRVRAMMRSLRVLNAMQARPPAANDQIPPLGNLGLPAEATTDPFDGEPLKVKKTPRGWMVYSVGADGVNDGGRLEKAADVGVGPAAEEAPKAP